MEKYLSIVKKHRLLVLGLAALLGLGVLYLFSQPSSSQGLDLASVATTSQSTAASGGDSSSATESSSSASQSGTVVVDVKGAVKKPGVYDLPAGSRVTDAIKKAGGFTDEANQKSINLAQKVQDEAVIYVAKEGEETADVTASSAASTSDATSGSSDSQGKINLNTATVAELTTISGIGEKRAQDIIDYRESKGGFTSVDELKNISGIGDKTFEKIKDSVTVG